jgi:uncharacterized membrane protein
VSESPLRIDSSTRTTHQGDPDRVDGRLHAVRWVIFGEVAFLFFMGVSVALHPGYVLARREGGISEYGLHAKTAVLYTFAWAALAGSNMRAARVCGGRGACSQKLRKLLLFYSAAISFVLVSTYFYSLDAVLKYIHYGFGAILVTFMSVAAYWLCRQLAGVTWVRAILWVQVLGSLAALLSIVGVVHVLFCAETISNVGCAILLAKMCHGALDERVEESAIVAVAQ